jgi:ornithine cyclodeaminase/alanine dehydrogenase
MTKMMYQHLLYLSRKDVEEVDLSISQLILVLEEAFRMKGEGRVDMPPKPGIHTRRDSFIHAMPAYVKDLDAAGVKWISGYPDNHLRGLPYITGLLILNDPETGVPISVMDATWITAKRTGVATAVAARYLARNDSDTVGIIACGVQGRGNLEALSEVFELSRVRAFDIDRKAGKKFALDMGRNLGLEVETVDSPREALRGVDIAVTSGPILLEPSPQIEADWLEPGGFACPLDFDSYWCEDAMLQVEKLATDDRDQLEHYREIGYFRTTPQPYADLGEIVAGRAPGRENDKERTMCINLGLALEDIVTAELIFREAKKRGLGLELPL